MSEDLFISADYHPAAKIELGKSGEVVVGAPRSGKTDALRNLVRVLEQNVSPDSILVLTPSRLAANQLRDWIALDSGRAASKPRARSITSFSFDTLSAKREIRLLSGASQERLLRRIIDEALSKKVGARWGFENETLALQGFVQELRDLLTVIVENSLAISDLTQLQSQYPKLKLQVAIDVLPEYLDLLQQQSLIDPAQLSIAAADNYVANTYQYVLVDDAHNLTPGQLRLVEKVMQSATGYLFGDPDCTTLGFRGSFPASFIELGNKAGLEIRTLTRPNNHEDLDSLLSNVAARIPVSLHSAHRPRMSGVSPVGYLFSSVMEETDWLASELRKHHIAGTSWDQMVVVGRTRNQLEQLSRELAARKVPVRIVGVQRSLKDQPMALAILDLIVIALGKTNLQQIEQLLLSPLVGLNSIELREVRRLIIPIRQEGKNQEEALLELLSENNAKFLQPVTQALANLRAEGELSAYQAVSMAWKLREKDAQLGKLSDSDLDSALELFAAAQRFDAREEGNALEFAIVQLTSRVPEDSLAPISQKPAVSLSTPAQLNGEYGVVAVPRLQEGIWPNLTPRNALLGASALQSFLLGRTQSPMVPARSELSEELRMFYRTIGAARKVLLLSAMSDETEQPSQFFALGKVELVETTATDFDLRKRVGRLRRSLFEGNPEAASELAALAVLKVPGAHPSSWQGLLEISSAEPLSRVGNRASASKLEEFEKCPLHWFISSFATDSTSFQASLGILLHAALENADSVKPTRYVERNWQEIEFDSALTERKVKREAEQMAELIEKYLTDSDDLVSAEEDFQLEIAGLTISGKIDRIENSKDGQLAVDLKTSKTAISKDKTAKNRQLAVYQLAIEKTGTSAGGRLVFVGGGKIQQREQPAINEELKAEITELSQKILQQLSQGELVASFDEHCSKDENCKLLLSRVITDA